MKLRFFFLCISFCSNSHNDVPTPRPPPPTSAECIHGCSTGRCGSVLFLSILFDNVLYLYQVSWLHGLMFYSNGADAISILNITKRRNSVKTIVESKLWFDDALYLYQNLRKYLKAFQGYWFVRISVLKFIKGHKYIKFEAGVTVLVLCTSSDYA